MWKPIRTLRLRLAALNLVVSGIALTTLCGVLLLIREQDIRDRFDERLTDRAERVAEAVADAAARRLQGDREESDALQLRATRFPGFHFQIRDGRGKLTRRSTSLGDATLPFEHARVSSGLDAPLLETLTGTVPESLFGPGGRSRVVTIHWSEPTQAPFFLQAAANTRSIDASVGRLRRLLAALLSIGLVTISLISWLVAHRSLAPIRLIADAAEQVTAGQLSRRIHTPVRDGEVARMVATLNSMLDRLEGTFEAQERFIANASHELKTPITVLLGEAQVLGQQDRTAEDYERFVRSVEQEMRRLGRLVDSLLTLARADAGFAPAAAVDVLINDLVTEGVQHCEPFASQRVVRLVPRLTLPEPEEGEPSVHGDPQLLRTAIENLLRNAIRHSPPDGVVEIDVEFEGETSHILVRDRGPGLPPAHVEQIFDRFYSAPQPGSPGPGVGLGLAIAKGVAELHGGTVHAANRPDGGSEFVIQLPLAGSRSKSSD